jgi:phosphonate dehydrogenase
MMPKIVVTQPIHEAVLARLRSAGDVVMNQGPEPWSEEELYLHLKDADAMMAFMPDRVDMRTLLNAPRLKTIACALKGYDNFDLMACEQAGVSVSFVPDLLTEPTAELAIGLAIAAARHVLAGDTRVRRGYAGWRPQLYGIGLHGSVVSVVGVGAVGRAIVDRLCGFGCAQLLGVDPHGDDERLTMVSLGEALSQSDYVILAVPLLDVTRHLVNDTMLEGVRRGQILVNIGRGSVVDEAAVARALKDERLGAYAADVYEMEDWLLADRPRQIHPELLQHPSTVFTPHIGSAVKKVRRAIELQAAENLLVALNGNEPLAHYEASHRAAHVAASHCSVQP